MIGCLLGSTQPSEVEPRNYVSVVKRNVIGWKFDRPLSGAPSRPSADRKKHKDRSSRPRHTPA